MKALVARVGRVDGYGDVAEHGFGAGGGDDDGAGSVGEGVADVVELAETVFVGDFEIGDGGLLDGVPVDDVGAAVDEALLVEADEGFFDGDGESRSSMVKYSRDQSTEAPRRRIWSVMAEPYFSFQAQTLSVKASRPMALRSVPSEASWRSTISLGGDAGVVGSGDPEGGFAGHAMPTGEDVHLGLVEHVAHVEAAGDVGGREEHGEGGALGGCVGCWSGDVEELFADPVVGPLLLDCGGVVGFGQVAGVGGDVIALGIGRLLAHR